MRNKLRKFSILSGLLALLTTICIICFIQNTYNVNNVYATTDATSTSDLGFIYNSETEDYKVKALNTSLTEAIIPSTYNGLPVTAIEDSGFMGCTSLEKVVIPSSIKSIGNNAFMRCTNLKKIAGMAGVTSYGDNAFSRCTSLDYMIMPANIESLGTNVIRNVSGVVYARASEEKMNSLNPNWNFDGNIVYNNEIVYEEYIDPITNEKGYQIGVPQLLPTIDEPLTIYSWCYYDENDTVGAKLLNIAEEAFWGVSAPSLIIKHPDGSNLNHSINLESFAFAYSSISSITFEVDITYEDSQDLFMGSTIQTVTLPASINVIPLRAFNNCNKLEKIIQLGQETENTLAVKRIEAGAFSGCFSLSELYISDDIEFIGQSAFGFWGTNIKQNVYINKFEEESADWNPNWKNDIRDLCEIEFTAASEFEITFIVTGENIINPIGYEKKVVSRNSTLNDINKTNPISDSHNFTGVWYTTADRQSGTEFSSNQPIKQNLTLYAGWNIKHFDVEFKINKYFNIRNAVDGSEIAGTTKNFEYGSNFQFYIILKDGYESPNVFYGVEKLQPQNESTYLFAVNITKNGIIDGTAALIEYQIDYIVGGGINPESNPTFYTVESPTIYLDAPHWEVYNNGVWTNNGIIEAGSTGYKVFYAQWSDPVVYTITYTNLRNGTNPTSNPRTYTYESGTIILAKPQWIAYETCVWDIPVIQAESSGNITVKAIWSNPTQFKIEYVLSGNAQSNPYNPTTYTIESPRIELDEPLGSPTEIGYKYYWNTYIIPAGSYGDKKIVSYSGPIRYTVQFDLFSCGAPDMDGWGIGVDYNEEFTINKLAHKDDSNYYIAYYDYGLLDIDNMYTAADDDFIVLSNENSVKVKNLTTVHWASVWVKVVYRPNCVTEGTLITLADGSQKAVENLDGSERLLVWNLFTGTFDTAPILFIDHEASALCTVINLYFSDGTVVKVISEHAFWDFNLNEYVFLRNDADKYIGHWFNKQMDNELGWGKVQLVDVKITKEITTAWSPVTFGHLCYYVNGMLSMPGATEGLINIFEVNSETLKINETLMQSDIEQYGLFTYDEFAEICPIPEEIFEAFNGQYLKISIGKGLICCLQVLLIFLK